ncbi:hypothetical protein F5Y09DRAFT_328963 [Xylaria sp. FL1042]|nr:hypothetical protein F5Y09DRAFT_328963 [Xylaria sp. FL1042]
MVEDRKIRRTLAPQTPSSPPPPASTHTTVLFSEPESQLPEHLPSVEEIENSPHVLKKLFSRRAVRVGEHYVVKYGTEVAPTEGENMIFARQHLKSLVPRVFAIYQRPGKGSSLITYIGTIHESQRLEVVNVLRNAFRIIRNLPAPDFFGGLGMTKPKDDIFWTREPDVARNGPFKTEEDLVHAIILRYRGENGGLLNQKADYYCLFTHGDFQRKNIMIGSGGRVAILDWAFSGWYPTWWEYSITITGCGAWKDDWHSYIPKVLDEFPSQHVWLHLLRLEMWS